MTGFDLEAWAEPRRRALQEHLDGLFQDAVPPQFGEMCRYPLQNGGKRIRPMMTLASARLCGYIGKRHISLAACVEFIHTATLLHDDVVDESDLRRGLASANVVWGNQASVLVGDFLFSRAFELMVDDGSLDVLQVLSRASSVIAEGEVQQLTTSNDTETGETAYLEVIRSKTAQLFSAACRIGALVADRPKVEEDALETFGMNLGITFQVIDDILDVTRTTEQLGKTAGKDLRASKATYPAIAGLVKSRQIANQLTNKSFAALKPFKGKAKALEAIARYL